MFVNIHARFYGDILGADDLTVSLEGLKLEELGCRQELRKRPREDSEMRLQAHVKQWTVKLINMVVCRINSEGTIIAMAMKRALNLIDGDNQAKYILLPVMVIVIVSGCLNHFDEK